MEVECFYTCPHCWQENSILAPLGPSEQEFIQDCEVCCNPLLFRITLDGDAVATVEVSPAQ